MLTDFFLLLKSKQKPLKCKFKLRIRKINSTIDLFLFVLKRITGLNPSDSNPYSSIKVFHSSATKKRFNFRIFIFKDSNLNVVGLSQECPSLVSGNPWRNPYSNPYVYDAAAAVALVGYGPYAAG